MRIKVVERFCDKFTHQMYKAGEVIEIEDASRVEDLENRKLAEGVEEKKVPKEKEEAKISLFEKEFEKKVLVEALKSIGEKGAMNMKEETLVANVTALDEEKTSALKKALNIE